MFSLTNMFSTKKSKSHKSKSRTKNNKTKKSSGNSVKELCSKKYKDKEVRGTPKNWAYNRCIRNPWERCKDLPPKGLGMYKYFCN